MIWGDDLLHGMSKVKRNALFNRQMIQRHRYAHHASLGVIRTQLLLEVRNHVQQCGCAVRIASVVSGETVEILYQVFVAHPLMVLVSHRLK